MTHPDGGETVVLDKVRDVIDNVTASTVFGVPISQDGLTVLPVAKITGGGGGGGGHRPTDAGQEVGTGGGLGVMAKPLGVFIIKDGKVRWRPAVDANRIILGGQVVMVVALLTIRAMIKRRRKR